MVVTAEDVEEEAAVEVAVEVAALEHEVAGAEVEGVAVAAVASRAKEEIGSAMSVATPTLLAVTNATGVRRRSLREPVVMEVMVVTVEDVVEAAAAEVSVGVVEVTAEAGEEVALTGEGVEEVLVVLTGTTIVMKEEEDRISVSYERMNCILLCCLLSSCNITERTS